MLENLDLDVRMEKEEWDAVSDGLKQKLGVLQQRIRALKIPWCLSLKGGAPPARGTRSPA